MKQLKRILILASILVFVLVTGIYAKTYTNTVVMKTKKKDPVWGVPFTGDYFITKKPVKMTSTNKKVGSLYWQTYMLGIKTKKTGKATLGFKLKGNNNKYKIKLYVLKDCNPFKSIKIGKEAVDGLKTIDNWTGADEYCFLPISSGKLSVTIKKGWKLVKIKASSDCKKWKTVKNNANIELKEGKTGALKFIIKNSKLGFKTNLILYRTDYFDEHPVNN